VNVLGAVVFSSVLNALGMSGSSATTTSKTKEASEKASTAPGYIRGLCGARLTGNLWMGCIAFFYVFAMGASNQALQHVNYPTQALGKSCKLIPIMLANVVINGTSYSTTKYLSVFFMTSGIVLFRMYKAPKANCLDFMDTNTCGAAKTCVWDGGSCGYKASEPNSTMGLLLLAASLCLDGLTASNQTLYRQEFSSPTLEGALRMMRQTNLWACLYVGVLAVATGDMFVGSAYIMEHPSLLWAIMKFSLCSACGQCFIFLTITGPGPLVCTTVTTTRKFFTILISVFLNPKNSLTQMQWGSVGLVAVGLGGELYEKAFSKKKHKKA
jgi:UDP-galactose transporter B1